MSRQIPPIPTKNPVLEVEADLPPKSLFSPDMPRYPNLWFDIPVREGESDEAAAGRLVSTLRETCALIDDFVTSNPEGSDDKARVQGLQPVSGFGRLEDDHDHDLHIRYYFSSLLSAGARMDAGEGPVVRLAASIHYEVAQKHPGHPYIDDCPVCGVTGEYAIPGDQCEKVHDPLGLELVLFGTVRGEPVALPSGSPFRPVSAIERTVVDVSEPGRSDINTLRIAHVRFTADGHS